jgi:hypothetical protein
MRQQQVNSEHWGKCRHRVDWHTNKLDTERHSISNVLDSQIFQDVWLLVPQGCTICVYFLFVCCLFFCGGVRGLVGQAWPSSLDIISTAFNCSHDTESEYIYGYGSWVVIFIVLFDISKNDPLLVPYILKSIRARSKQLILNGELDLYRIWWNKPHQNLFCNNLPYIYQDDKAAQWSLPSIVYISS